MDNNIDVDVVGNTLCDWTTRIQCSPIWTSEYAYTFGLLTSELDSEPTSKSQQQPEVTETSFWRWLASLTLADLLTMPNDLYLMCFYVAQIILSEKKGPKFVKSQLVLSTMALLVAGWMAHAFFFVFNIWFCPIAAAQFGVNCGVAIANVSRWRAIKKLEQSKKA